jgi:MFS family permease
MMTQQSTRWSRQAGGLPRTFWYLWVGTLINRLGGVVVTFLALYLTGERGLSTGEAGLVLTAYGIGSFIGQPVGGLLADQWGRRATLLAGLVGGAGALFCLGLAGTLPVILVIVTVYGVCLNGARPALQAAVADVVPGKDRARAYALNFWAVNLGFGIGIPIGGVLAGQGWWWLLGVDIGSMIVFAGIIWARVPETRPARTPSDLPGSLREVLRDRLLLTLVACLTAQGVVYLQAYTTLPLVMARDGLDASGYGIALGLNGVLIIVLQPFLLGIITGRPRGQLLLVSGVLQGLGIALHGLASTLITHMAAVAVWTVGEVLQAGLLATVVASLAPEHLRGRYLGVFGTSFGLAQLLAPLFGTQTLEQLGEGVLWITCAVVGVASAIGLKYVSQTADQRKNSDTEAL